MCGSGCDNVGSNVVCVLVGRFNVCSMCVGFFNCMCFRVMCIGDSLVEWLNSWMLSCLVWFLIRFLKLVGMSWVVVRGVVSVRVSVIVNWVMVGVCGVMGGIVGVVVGLECGLVWEVVD